MTLSGMGNNCCTIDGPNERSPQYMRNGLARIMKNDLERNTFAAYVQQHHSSRWPVLDFAVRLQRCLKYRLTPKGLRLRDELSRDISGTESTIWKAFSKFHKRLTPLPTHPPTQLSSADCENLGEDCEAILAGDCLLGFVRSPAYNELLAKVRSR